MHHLGKRIWLLMAIGALAVPVAATGLAHACTGLATVSTNPGAGASGDVVTLSGKGFAPHDSADIRTSAAVVHMDTTDGPVIATADPSSGNTGGNFAVQMTVPNAEAGDHVLIVTQAGLDGRPAYGTPARTVFKVMPTAAPAVAEAPAAMTAPTLVAPSLALPTPSRTTPRRSARSRAISRCNAKYSTKNAKTAAGRKRMAAKRSSCVRKANRIKA